MAESGDGAAAGDGAGASTELVYLTDAYRRDLAATVVAVRPGRPTPARRRPVVALDRTILLPDGGAANPTTPGPWPAPASSTWPRRAARSGTAGPGPERSLPSVGDLVPCQIDWDRRHALMRTHTALHVLCGVIWREWATPVTGGNMEPLAARMDFEFDPCRRVSGPGSSSWSTTSWPRPGPSWSRSSPGIPRWSTPT